MQSRHIFYTDMELSSISLPVVVCGTAHSHDISSDAGVTGTNLKVGGTGPERKWGAPIFLVVPVHFLALKAQLFVLVSAFV